VWFLIDGFPEDDAFEAPVDDADDANDAEEENKRRKMR
jgi:hypothetical protein